MPKQTKAKKRPSRDASQTALSIAERAIGGKLVDQSATRKPKPQPQKRPTRGITAKA
jgi:hypothetical protein